MDQSRFLRQWSLLHALAARTRGMTIDDMCAETGMNARTVRRDLAVLKSLGIPLTEQVGDHGRKHWRLSESFRSPPLHFTITEALALHLGWRFLTPLAGTYIWEGASQVNRSFCDVWRPGGGSFRLWSPGWGSGGSGGLTPLP